MRQKNSVKLEWAYFAIDDSIKQDCPYVAQVSNLERMEPIAEILVNRVRSNRLP